MAAEKEIDLIDIISYILEYTKKKFILILTILIICIAIPFIYYSLKQKYYTSKMVMTTNTASFTLVEQIAQPLILSIKYNNDSITSQMLGNSPAVQHLQAMEVQEAKTNPTERKEGCTFTIELTSSDPRAFSALNESLPSYFNSNVYIQNISSVKLKRLQDLHTETSRQIKRLDSVQRSVPGTIKHYQTEKGVLNDLNLGTLYEEMLALKTAETETLEKIDLIDEFKTISGFTIVEPTKGPLFYIGIGLILGIILNIFFLITSAVNMMIREKKA